ncbi:hypothetical protein IWT25_00737 [Secundilactobacillus pentosiphilus]|uniref:Uncharacterized protein n=1 Tax=Secundilactobacillus pentosiphilus TaxID=1714682 RepID=A0A1Z5IUK3_9LACO|nr:hypothetical protein [Secundilactobacillus pentosiphilus]GAX05433.1 hypothetical protein IWT25_00737 [Secundilactobacillus pentosiphilus]
MTDLPDSEKEMNTWWVSRFDKNNYKTIRLFNHRQLMQTYSTANALYSDVEDAESAFWTASQANMAVTCVAVGNKRYKKINGKIRQIASMEVDE